jgi:hypothetical protein
LQASFVGLAQQLTGKETAPQAKKEARGWTRIFSRG